MENLLSHLAINLKRTIRSQLNWAILLCDVISDGKTAQLWQTSGDLRTVLSSRLSQRELRCSLGEFHSFLSFPADTTMASSQGIPVSSNSFSRWTSHDIRGIPFQIPILASHLRISFFSDNIMADVASKQQTTASILSTIVTRTRRHNWLKKLQTLWETCAVPENSVQLFLAVFYTVKLHSLT